MKTSRINQSDHTNVSSDYEDIAVIAEPNDSSAAKSDSTAMREKVVFRNSCIVNENGCIYLHTEVTVASWFMFININLIFLIALFFSTFMRNCFERIVRGHPQIIF